MKDYIKNNKRIILDLLNLLSKDVLIYDEKVFLIKNFNLHFYFFRYSNMQWQEVINEELKKQNKEHLSDLFSFKIKLEERHYHSLKYISETKAIPSVFFNINQRTNGYDFFLSYKSNFMLKHFQSCVFHVYRFIGFKYKNNQLLDAANKTSLSGKLFESDHNGNRFFFIPLNRSSTFLFLDSKKILSLDVSVDYEIDSMILIPHFLIAHDSYSENISDFKNKMLFNTKIEHDDIIKSYCKNNKVDLEKIINNLKLNCNYLMCFENGIGNNIVSKQSLSTIKTVCLEKNKVHDCSFGNRFYTILFNQLFYASKIEGQKIIDRDYFISYLIDSVFENNFDLLIQSFEDQEQEYIKNGLIERFMFILRGLDKENSNFYSFKNACIKSGIEKDSIILKLYSILTEEKKYKKLPTFILNNLFVKEARLILVRSIVAATLKESQTNKDSVDDIINKLSIYVSTLTSRNIKKMLKNI